MNTNAATKMIPLEQLNTNPIFQPPKEWLEEIDKEEKEIINDFFSFYPELHNMIDDKRKDLERGDFKIWKDYETTNFLIYKEQVLNIDFKTRFGLDKFLSKKMLLAIHANFYSYIHWKGKFFHDDTLEEWCFDDSNLKSSESKEDIERSILDILQNVIFDKYTKYLDFNRSWHDDYVKEYDESDKCYEILNKAVPLIKKNLLDEDGNFNGIVLVRKFLNEIIDLLVKFICEVENLFKHFKIQTSSVYDKKIQNEIYNSRFELKLLNRNN